MLDYTSALNIKSALLPPSSRALASVHYQIATVLEFTPDRRPDALSHVEKALSGFRERRAELSAGGGDISDEVSKLGSKEKEAEMRDVDGLIGDLEVKIEELKAAPPAEDLVSESINHLLGQSGSGEGVGLRAEKGKEDGPVNDLTGMVRKKAPKKDGKVKGVEGVNGNVDGNSYRNMAEGVNGEKRKGEGEEGSATKKARVE